jgi:hypothetical protein
MSRTIPILPLWALMACTGVNFTFLLTGTDKKCGWREYVVTCYKVQQQTEYCDDMCHHKGNIHLNSTGHQK